MQYTILVKQFKRTFGASSIKNKHFLNTTRAHFCANLSLHHYVNSHSGHNVFFFCCFFLIYTKNFCSCFLIEADAALCVCIHIMFVCNLTQYSQHSVVLKHFHGARADKVYSLQSVTLANKELPRSTERSFDDERQRAQTPSTGRFKQRQLKQLFIQVHGNVSPQFIWEVLQKLGNDKDILSTLSILVILKNIFFFYV